MRYAPKQWGAVAIVMRDSTFKILEALSQDAKTWTQLKDFSSLTDGGVQKIVKELINRGAIEEKLFKKQGSELKEKRYALTDNAKKEKIFEKAKALKEALNRLQK
ncbi:MAG TPA: hypothetical protein VJH23_06705 [archaeon]|nr:hypothetical protein [archaeon]